MNLCHGLIRQARVWKEHVVSIFPPEVPRCLPGCTVHAAFDLVPVVPRCCTDLTPDADHLPLKSKVQSTNPSITSQLTFHVAFCIISLVLPPPQHLHRNPSARLMRSSKHCKPTLFAGTSQSSSRSLARPLSPSLSALIRPPLSPRANIEDATLWLDGSLPNINERRTQGLTALRCRLALLCRLADTEIRRPSNATQ